MMQATKERITEVEFFEEIYKNAKMGADAIINLLPKVRDDSLRSAMTMQLDGYEKYAARAEEALDARGETAREEGLVTRLTAKVGMAWDTMLDSTASHIAELVIEGSNMSITALTRLLNSFEAGNCDCGAVRLAHEVLSFERHNLEMMKPYL